MSTIVPWLLTYVIAYIIIFVCCLQWAWHSGSDVAVVVVVAVILAGYVFFIGKAFGWDRKAKVATYKVTEEKLKAEFENGYTRGFSQIEAKQFMTNDDQVLYHAHNHGWYAGDHDRIMEAAQAEVAEIRRKQEEEAAALAKKVEQEEMIRTIVTLVKQELQPPAPETRVATPQVTPKVVAPTDA